MSRGPAELRDFVPDPIIIFFGCQPYRPLLEGERCLCCKGLPIGPGQVCGWCLAIEAADQAKVDRARAAGLRAIDRAEREAAEEKARAAADLAREGQAALSTLTEAHRRRLWNGYRGGIKAENPEPNELALLGRAWLTAGGAAPDWSLELDRRGRIKGGSNSREATP